MAGGRRPASYASGARHHTVVDRATPSGYDGPTSPALASTIGPSLPLWIPSIWQPAPAKPSASDMESLPPRERRRSAANDASSALAAALDSAVQSAVVRALGSAAPAVPDSPQLHSSSIDSDAGLDEDSSSIAMSAKERELTEMVDILQQRLADRDDDVRLLSERLKDLEVKVVTITEASERREERLVSELASQRSHLTDMMADLERRLTLRATSIHDQVKANQSSISKLRSTQKSKDGELRNMSTYVQEVAEEVHLLSGSVSSQFDRHGAKLDQLDASVTSSIAKMQAERSAEGKTAVEKDVEELQRSVASAVETVTGMRSKVKRVDAQMLEVSKKATESMELSYGFEQSLQGKFDEVQATVRNMQEVVMHHRPVVGEADSDNQVESKVEALEGNVKALKKLIESNLRTQWSAESIVKEQVSLITKHVCVAMRQYTARRISENNALIDRALRARVPQYAKNEDQFVLVREEDYEGNESIDIQRTSDMSSLSGSG